MKIYESAEDYLETILILREERGQVRSIDIAHRLDFTKASVSIAMKRFRENGYVEVDSDGYITLLPPGEEIAQRVYGRHKLLTRFLCSLGVGEQTAAADACKIEHDLSEETFQRIEALMKKGG